MCTELKIIVINHDVSSFYFEDLLKVMCHKFVGEFIISAKFIVSNSSIKIPFAVHTNTVTIDSFCLHAGLFDWNILACISFVFDPHCGFTDIKVDMKQWMLLALYAGWISKEVIKLEFSVAL